MKFNGQRLRDALQFRGKKMAELSRETGISRQSLSLYANEENVPPCENVQKIAKNLDFPSEYFLSEDKCTTVTTNTYFRSQAAAKKKEQNAQEKKLEYTAKMYEILLNYVDFPALHLIYASLIGGLVLLFIENMDVEVAIAIQCVANLLMGLTDLKAKKNAHKENVVKG